MITQPAIIALLKPSGEARDVSVTVGELYKLIPFDGREKVLLLLIRMTGVRVTNSYEGGIVVPKEYFE